MTRSGPIFTAFLIAVPWLAQAQSGGVLHDQRETHLADVRQMTFGGENAEAYWSPDSSELVFQRTHDDRLEGLGHLGIRFTNRAFVE